MTTRQELAARLAAFFPPGLFIYGAYRGRPNGLPYGNYERASLDIYRADDKLCYKRTIYIVRIVTERKDFELEQRIEDLFEELEVSWDLYDEAYAKEDKVHATEYAVEIIE